MCMKLQTCKYSTISAVELGSSKALDSEFVKARFWFIDCFATCSNAGLWNRADAQSLSCSLFFFFFFPQFQRAATRILPSTKA